VYYASLSTNFHTTNPNKAFSKQSILQLEQYSILSKSTFEKRKIAKGGMWSVLGSSSQSKQWERTKT